MKSQSPDTKFTGKTTNFKPGKGGGVVLHIRDDMLCFVSCALNGNKCASLWCKIITYRPNKREIVIGSSYKSNWQVKHK